MRRTDHWCRCRAGCSCGTLLVLGRSGGELSRILPKIGSKRDFCILGEAEGANAGQFGEKTSTNPHRCLHMVTHQYTEALLEVCVAAWPLTMPITAQGGRRRAIFGVLGGTIGFKSRLLGKIHCVLSFLYLPIYPKDAVSAWTGVWTVPWPSFCTMRARGGRHLSLFWAKIDGGGGPMVAFRESTNAHFSFVTWRLV